MSFIKTFEFTHGPDDIEFDTMLDAEKAIDVYSQLSKDKPRFYEFLSMLNEKKIDYAWISLSKRRIFSMTKAEKAHKAALVDLGCALCARLGYGKTPPQLHHLRGGGWGKGGYKTLIPLCYEHHLGNSGIHGMGTKAFERHYGVTQKELLQWALERIK